jgi:peptidoglycan hydrolase-like protein with peptidoglycan-binding domain
MPVTSARKTARHAKPSTVAPAIAAGGLTAAFVVADGAALATASSAAVPSTVGRAAATADDFARLRQCESGGNYRANTGNGYYGAYQFSASTWRGIGYSGMPHQASPGTQDEAAAKLQARSGWGQWPACSRKLGLGRSGYTPTHAAPAAGKHAAPKAARKAAPKKPAAQNAAPKKSAAPKATPARASRTRVAAPRTAPLLDRAITLEDRGTYRLVVAQWQARMKQRGWSITVDGRFGPRSAEVAQRFAAEKGLTSTPAGTVDRALMTAAWTAPLQGALPAPAAPRITFVAGALRA